MKESEFVSDTFAEHDSNEISELRKSLNKSLGVESSENGKLKKNPHPQKIFEHELKVNRYLGSSLKFWL